MCIIGSKCRYGLSRKDRLVSLRIAKGEFDGCGHGGRKSGDFLFFASRHKVLKKVLCRPKLSHRPLG